MPRINREIVFVKPNRMSTSPSPDTFPSPDIFRTITVLDETDAQKKERLKGKLGEFAQGMTILGLDYSGSSVIGKFGIGKYIAVGNKAADVAETLSETAAKGATKVDDVVDLTKGPSSTTVATSGTKTLETTAYNAPIS